MDGKMRMVQACILAIVSGIYYLGVPGWAGSLRKSNEFKRSEHFVDYGEVYPAKYALGPAATLDAHTTYYTKQMIALSASDQVLTIDYGVEAAGFPFFEVVALSAPTQIEVKYAEQWPALAEPQSDGPWTYTNGLANTFRVETFNLTVAGRVESFFVQGGQRWQTVRLLTNTTVTFSAVGLKATSAHVPVGDVPGQFATSNAVYNGIWALGARVAQVACVDAGNAPSTWQITSEGALIRGQQTAQSVKGATAGNYTLAFATKIVRGGTGWKVASGFRPYGASFILTSDYPTESTFVNTNRTLLPPNTLIFNYGWGIFNQTSAATGWNQYFELDEDVHEGQWYNISTTITANGYNVTLDGKSLAFVPIDEAAYYASSAYFGSGSATGGTWGFGPSQDQEAYFKDVTVAAENSTLLYANSLLANSTLAEYNVAPLDTSVCLDGAKRDRLVWTGDFYHTNRVIAASTLRYDYVLGTIKYILSWQRQSAPYKGFVHVDPMLGARPEYEDVFLSQYAALQDYQDLFLSGVGNYFRSSGDIAGLQPYWNQIKAQVTAQLASIDPLSGLMVVTNGYYFLGPSNGSAVTALGAHTLRKLVPLAQALGDDAAASLYEDTANNLSQAINDKLWNPSLGVYSLSLDAPSNYSLTAIAFTILSGTANSTQASAMISRLPELRLGVGYKTNSGDADSGTTQLSPNTQGFLLEALFQAHRDLGVQNLTVAKTLLDDLWSKMVTQNEYYSGASWEYLYPDGSPGIDLFTSLAHPWGAAPTYVMPEYVLGIAPTSPGYSTWEFRPLLQGLGLTEANGTVVTPYGSIEAKWEITGTGDSALVVATVPKGTNGTLVLPDGADAQCDGQSYRGGHVKLHGGKRTRVTITSGIAK
ncbi:hypothetical protein LTR36_003320 [Oleoguttula mirabilis]|uniref:Alpha-L-rhamnosidase n=1 Tax=Oleoguttula mirabilis TaxID=1507867 RepID=A0AAV9K0E3_9PEZI|nr:hypothetical protein LTR36_003320 [Oleoguttula mirabilis]